MVNVNTSACYVTIKQFLKLLFFFKGEKKGGRKRGRETLVAYCPQPRHMPWESNQRPLVLQDNAQTTEPHWSGPSSNFMSISTEYLNLHLT